MITYLYASGYIQHDRNGRQKMFSFLSIFTFCSDAVDVFCKFIIYIYGVSERNMLFMTFSMIQCNLDFISFMGFYFILFFYCTDKTVRAKKLV